MSIFTSKRERRLWIWVLVVMVAIYGTLGPARLLVDTLREHNLLRVSFALGVLILVVIIAAQWMKKKPGWHEFGVALGVAFAYLVMFVRMGTPEERTHLVEYGIVAALIHQALQERVRNGRFVTAPATLTVGITAVLGIFDECIQAVLPNRVFDIRDIVFNALAGFMAIVARLAVAKQQRPGWRIWFLWLMAGSIGWGLGMEAATLGGSGGLRTLFSSPNIIVSGYLGVTVGGVLAGVLQWLVLRPHIPKANFWVPTIVGAAVVSGAVVIGVGTVNADIGWVLGATLFGPSAGVLQWLIIRRQLERAGWWVLASTVGWCVGMPMGGSYGWMALGAVYAAVTGTSLVLLLRKGASEG